jgi:N-acetylmuramoyl-L-alanine amidase
MNKIGYAVTGLLAFLFLWTTALQAKEKAFTVVIDAGHGGKDPGAKGSLINEKAINLAVALKLGNMISTNHKDVNVIYTRTTDRFVELYERANIANRNKADLFISIHANSLKKKNSTVKGAETYTLGLAKTDENLEVAMQENSVILLEENYLQQYGGFDPNSSDSYIIFDFMQNKHMEQSVLFASEIQKAFASAKRVNRGVRQGIFIVLKATSMPSVLVELGFICNREEERYMRSAQGQTQLAKSIYTAFVKYKNDHVRKQIGYGVEKTTPSSENEKETAQTTSPAKKDLKSNTVHAAPVRDTAGKIVYKVQILSSDKKLPAGSPAFKGYKNVGYYQDGKLHKYTYGESTDMKTILKIQKEVSKDFPDAFIIRVKDGKRLK